MIPPKSDPQWVEIVKNPDRLPVTSLPVKMLLMRVKMVCASGSQQKINEAIGIAYEFFLKNEAILVEDVATIFGERGAE